ncbi:MAG: ATP-binding protein [Clostridiales bacterium]|nr:ATP-binding protein [Clostridiales bacterium]
MGIYLNPGNEAFKMIRKRTYVDKTGLIDYVNSVMETSFRMICSTRPRRFGKSFAARMLCAYYDRSCDSRALFEGLEISKKDSFGEYLNKYDVIYLDITRAITRAKNRGVDIVSDIQQAVIDELTEAYPDSVRPDEVFLPDALAAVSQTTRGKFFVIIDEWDALFREAKNNADVQKEYVQFMRGLFKGGPATDAAIAGAYITGILPIKKYGTQSAMTDFREYTMIDPLVLSEYIGFTEPEVRKLCDDSGLPFEMMKQWYDGYSFSDVGSIYSPNSVMNAVTNRKFKNYWTTTEAYESLTDYITMNFDGLKDAIIQMLGGQRVEVYTMTFQNDVVSFKNRDDVLTLLIHLGYLAYDDEEKEAYIPNLEVADSFRAAVKGSSWTEVERSLSQSDKLLKATIRGDAETVAEALELAHETCTSSLAYNDENSLSCAILFAYYTARNHYEIFRELPTGKGFADYAFIPRKGSDKPAMVIELKYNKSADSAIRQIKEKRYDGKLKGLGGELLLVGINYDKDAKGADAKKHTCVIEHA